MTDLTGRRMLVVGGSTGIGRGVADAWAAAGADVVVCSRGEPARAAPLRWEPLDLIGADAVDRLTALGAGPLDAVCFAAVRYGARRAPFGAVPEDEWLGQLDVNVTGLRRTLAATLPALRAARPGLFVGVSSEVAFNPGPGRSGYAATKAAARALLDAVAQEEDPADVRIVQILPAGMVDTPGIRRRRPPGFDYGSYMRPSAFAPLALHLAATAGHHGESLVVDGDGTWWSVHDRAPVSQSGPVR